MSINTLVTRCVATTLILGLVVNLTIADSEGTL